MTKPETKPEHADHPETGPNVTITIDNKNYTVHRGNTTVSELKQLAGIPAAYELEQIVDGKLEPLRDDQHAVLKGGERFVSHPRAGASS
jgi:predicted Rdx family selenoprotein